MRSSYDSPRGYAQRAVGKSRAWHTRQGSSARIPAGSAAIATRSAIETSSADTQQTRKSIPPTPTPPLAPVLDSWCPPPRSRNRVAAEEKHTGLQRLRLVALVPLGENLSLHRLRLRPKLCPPLFRRFANLRSRRRGHYALLHGRYFSIGRITQSLCSRSDSVQ